MHDMEDTDSLLKPNDYMKILNKMTVLNLDA